MKKWLALLLLLINASLYAQNKFVIKPQPGKIFITKKMDQNIEFKTDTTITTSFAGKSYKIKNDTLFLKEEYEWFGPNNSRGHKITIRDYKILFANSDTIILRDRHTSAYKPKEDILTFINLEKLKQPIPAFKKITLQFIDWAKASYVNVDSLGNIDFYNYQLSAQGKKEVTLRIELRLSPSEFQTFKDILERSLIRSLPPQTACGLDETPDLLTLTDGTGIFTSKGCTVSLPQQLLITYLKSFYKPRASRSLSRQK